VGDRASGCAATRARREGVPGARREGYQHPRDHRRGEGVGDRASGCAATRARREGVPGARREGYQHPRDH
ncbi:hypothetical protein CTI14_71735, partial [Methylobacterium radiotolerans]